MRLIRTWCSTDKSTLKRTLAEGATDVRRPTPAAEALIFVSACLCLLFCVCFPGYLCPLRYAAEAMHLSEEVRLLAAKLKAADDKAQARLAQVWRHRTFPPYSSSSSSWPCSTAIAWFLDAYNLFFAVHFLATGINPRVISPTFRFERPLGLGFTR